MRGGLSSRRGIGVIPLILAMVVVLAVAILLYRNWIAGTESGKTGPETAMRPSGSKAAPPFSLKDTNGNIYSSAQLAGKPAAINFFATGVPPARPRSPDSSRCTTNTDRRGSK